MNEDVIKILEQKNIKPTSMRGLIFNVLKSNGKALSLYEIEQRFDNVDRSTIFRTIKKFQKNHLIHSIDNGSGSIKYALCDEDCICSVDELHVHFLCTRCGQTSCLKETPIPTPDLPSGFTVENANFVIKGCCPSCQ